MFHIGLNGQADRTEADRMEVKVKITLDVNAMSEFMIYHIYTGKAGMAILALGALNTGLAAAFGGRGDWVMTAVFAVFSLLLLFGFPFAIRRKVASMKGAKRLTEPVEYTFNEEGIQTVTPEKTGKASWKRFQKAVSRKNILILYDAQRHAIILPIEQLGDQYNAVVDMIVSHIPPSGVRIKKQEDRRQK